MRPSGVAGPSGFVVAGLGVTSIVSLPIIAARPPSKTMEGMMPRSAPTAFSTCAWRTAEGGEDVLDCMVSLTWLTAFRGKPTGGKATMSELGRSLDSLNVKVWVSNGEPCGGVTDMLTSLEIRPVGTLKAVN